MLYKYLILTPVSLRKIYTCTSYGQNVSMTQTKQGKSLNDSSALSEYWTPLPEMEGHALTPDNFLSSSLKFIDLQLWMK